MPSGVRRVAPAACVAWLAGGVAPEALSQGLSSTLVVTVADVQGRPLPAEVQLDGPAFRLIRPTDARGQAFFPHLTPARYRIEATAGEKSCVPREIEVGAACATLIRCTPGTAESAPPELSVTTQGCDQATWASAAEVGRVPRPADPWSVLRDVPGILVDRVDVGGSETAQQSLLVSRGDLGAGATWSIDGYDVTDPAAVGSTMVYPDMGALEGIETTAGSADVRTVFPGPRVALALLAPRDRFFGAAHVRGSGDALQADNGPGGPASRSFLRNRTEVVTEMGATVGGAAFSRRLSLWVSAQRNALRQQTFTEHEERLRTTSLTVKAGLPLGAGRLSLLALRSEKEHEDRDPGFSAAPEARWRQSGPTWLVGLEDRRSMGRVSVSSRLAWLDAGFRLDPQGGTSASAYEDPRGVAQRSYYSFRTDRGRLQTGLEAVTRRSFLFGQHRLVFGLGYERMPVSTFQGWPGNEVQGLDRQSVFFRTFRLTGFAIPYRDMAARSLNEHSFAYVQDEVRFGRFDLLLGARLDRQAGHNRASSVDANPEFPDLLPAVSFGGAPGRFRWLDLLPRAAVTWDVQPGTMRAGLAYAAYAARLGSGDVVFDNPIGREFGSVVYYWIDRNADTVVERGELGPLRGQLADGGIDPTAPGSVVSPNVVDPGLRAPRTHELLAFASRSFGSALTVGLSGSFRRLVNTLWRPLRGLSPTDYTARGAVSGELFGRSFNVVFFGPVSTADVVPGNGRGLENRRGYRQEAVSAELTARGRIGAHVQWNAWGAYADAWERFLDREGAIQDPTPLDSGPLQDYGRLAARPGGLGRGDVFVNARWSAGASVSARLPWRVETTWRAWARDGFPLPYYEVGSSGDSTAGQKNVLIAPTLDAYRLPHVFMLDARLARATPLKRGVLTVGLDVFNVLNQATTLQVERDLELPSFDRPREVVRPLVLRVSLDWRF